MENIKETRKPKLTGMHTEDGIMWFCHRMFEKDKFVGVDIDPEGAYRVAHPDELPQIPWKAIK